MRILIAEDETIIRIDIRGVIEHAGFEVCGEAKDGEEAVELARSLAPDLAILDVKMPRLDGLAAARRIYAERPLPIVMLTAFSQRKLVAEAVQAGVFAYLVKPFRPQEIVCAVETAAARHGDLQSARRELGRKPPSAPPPIAVNVPGSDGNTWPIRIGTTPGGALDVSLDPEGASSY
jgi:two-component system, response regulator PdtaR